MRRLIGAFAVLGLVAAVGATGFAVNVHTANSVKYKLEQSVESAQKGEMKTALKQIDDAKNEWEKMMEIIMLFESHGKVDEIQETIGTAALYLDRSEKNMFYAECNLAGMRLQHFSDVEYPNIINIF